MTQNQVSQVVSILGIRSMYHVRVECDVESYAWRVGIIQKSLWILLGFLCDIGTQTVSIPPHQNMSMPLGQNPSILVISNIHSWNNGTFWHKKLCMKTWYSSKSLWMLSIFLGCFLDPSCSYTSNSQASDFLCESLLHCQRFYFKGIPIFKYSTWRAHQNW